MFCSSVKILAMIIFQCAFEADALIPCESNSNDSRSLGISVNSKKSDHGKWMDSFYARAEHSSTLSNISVDVMHNVSECGGRRVIHIQGLMQNGNNTVSDQQISSNPVHSVVFHSKHGSNVVVSKDGRTIEKKKLDVHDNGAAFTNRPLGDNELFEIRLDQKGKRWNQCFAIGILTINPDDYVPIRSAYVSRHAIMYHNDGIYSNELQRKYGYGKNLNGLPVGTRLGVMKKPSGDVHFFINQVDQGLAISDISDPIYGVADLWQDTEKVTILAP